MKKIANVEIALDEIEKMISRKKDQAMRLRHAGNEDQAKYFDGEANGLTMAHARIQKALEAA